MNLFTVLSFGLLLMCLSSLDDAVAANDVELGNVSTETFPLSRQASGISFSTVPSTDSAISTTVAPLLQNGDLVDKKYFPTVFRTFSADTLCTAVLVGEAAILTAAHCITDETYVDFGFESKTVTGFCERAPKYNAISNKSEDWSLCLLQFPVLNMRYERVSTQIPKPGLSITLMGYGCTKPGSLPDFKLRIGLSNTVSADSTYLPYSENLIYSYSNLKYDKNAVLCIGDSGGPMFYIVGNTYTSAREILGINSGTTGYQGYSIFAATGSASAQKFFIEWTGRHRQKICGINESNTRCM